MRHRRCRPQVGLREVGNSILQGLYIFHFLNSQSDSSSSYCVQQQFSPIVQERTRQDSALSFTIFGARERWRRCKNCCASNTDHCEGSGKPAAPELSNRMVTSSIRNSSIQKRPVWPRYANHRDHPGCHTSTICHSSRFPALDNASTTPKTAKRSSPIRKQRKKSGLLTAVQSADSEEGEGREGEAEGERDEEAEETSSREGHNGGLRLHELSRH